MADEEVVVQITTVTKGTGAKDAKKEMNALAEATKAADQLTKKLIGTGAAVALAYKGIQATVKFIGSAIKDSVMANEQMAAKVNAASAEWGKFKSYVGDTLVSFLEQTGILDNMGQIVTALANSFNFVKTVVLVLGNNIVAAVLEPIRLVLKAASLFSDTAKEAVEIIEDMQEGLLGAAGAAYDAYTWDSKILDTQKDNAKILKENEDLAKKRADAEKKAKEEIERQVKALEDYKQKLREASMERTVEFTATVSTSAKDNDIEAYVDQDRELEKQKELNDAIMLQKEEMYANDKVRYAEVLAEKEILEQEYNQKRLALDEAYNIESNEALKKYKATQTATYKQAFGTITEVAKLAQSENKKLAAVGKAAAIAEATMNTYQGATKALAQGGFWGIAMAAAVIANGLASVAKIQGVALAKGGVIEATPGGVPAVIGEGGSDEAVLPLDSQQAMSRVGQAISEAGGAGGGANDINLNVVFSGEFASLFTAFIEATRNGDPTALQYANISYKTGAVESGMAI
ncbi:hypothetical protein Dip510_001651 [Elusimicrobium posterum]|uniref:hypothetical protein n=1 Tax=Elusimicrobium posterum TaxID=3116653 RepID=UPI003C791E03